MQDPNEILRRLKQFPNGIIAFVDRDLRFTFITGSGLTSSNLTAEDFIGKTLNEIYPAEIAERDEPALRAALAGETRLQDVTFGERLFRVFTQPTYSDEGEVDGVMIVTQDITDLVTEDAALARSLTESDHVIVWVNDHERVLYMNDAYERIFGYSKWPLYQDMTHFTEHLHEDDKARIQAKTELAPHVFKDVYRVVRPDGTIRWIESRVYPLMNSEGQPVRGLGVAEDVTASKQLEQALVASDHRDGPPALSEPVRAILKSVPDTIVIATPDLTIELVSDSVEELFAYTADELVGQPVTRIIPPGLVEQLQASALDHDGHARETRHITARRAFEAEVSLIAIYQDDGTPARLAFIVRDVTTITEVERLKEQLIASVSHELRTPTTNLKLYHFLLESNPTKADQYLGVLKRETRRLERIIEALIAAAEVEQRTTLDLEAFDLAGLLNTLIGDRQSLAAEQQITLTFTGAPAYIEGDRALVERAMANLLDNALLYSLGNAEAQVNVTLEVESSHVVVRISDTGYGIKDTEAIFTRFHRGEAARALVVPGMGLGLSIAKEVIERHKGRIHAVSDGIRGKGSIFTVRLPIHERSVPTSST